MAPKVSNETQQMSSYYHHHLHCKNNFLSVLPIHTQHSIKKLTILISNFNLLIKVIHVICKYKVGQKIKKSPGQKSLWNQINQFHEIIFWPNSIFLQFQKWPKIDFWTRKKFKIAKNAILWGENQIYLISWVFFAWTFLNFLAYCGTTA